jgi:hypothetical protein
MTSDDVLRGGYAAVYRSFGDLREAFHSSGRFDDSNAKLDEVTKLFAAYVAFRRGQISSFPKADDQNPVDSLQRAFAGASTLPEYRLPAGESVFGSAPTLGLRQGDDVLARQLIRLVRNSIDLAFELSANGTPFDILNEAFGHFVRDNFRSNIEDAQYMTPPEVVDFMVAMAFEDLLRENEYVSDNRTLTIADPTCGVGSFLTAAYHYVRQSEVILPRNLRLIGQDKVDRMVRLSTLNLLFSEVRQHQITAGNSLAMGSPLDDFNGQVDLILTNPPFGARFDRDMITRAFGENTPFFSGLKNHGASVDSELLFIDRNLELLRPGGRMLIVVPDGVVSARGVASMLRHHLMQTVAVRAIVELPSVTFAQAGTRTRTAVLFVQKGQPEVAAGNRVFLAVVGDLGFQVKSRKGVQVKVAEGNNELRAVLDSYRALPSTALGPAAVLGRKPSVVAVPSEAIQGGDWTPNHHNARRYDSVARLRSQGDLRLVPLKELVTFAADSRRTSHQLEQVTYISVLHVLGEAMLDVRAIKDYQPKTPGVPTRPGEILLSRINPRISRVCVVPPLVEPILCSPEFEIMIPKDRVDPFILTYLLQAREVYQQICSLTSGTSASHNRIRTADLGNVVIPYPADDSPAHDALSKIGQQYRRAVEQAFEASVSVAALRKAEDELFASMQSPAD